MKKGVMTTGVLAIIACAVTAYCWAAGREDISEEATAAHAAAGQQAASAANAAKGKSLVVYFSVPETDGVDASSGASRVLSGGKTIVPFCTHGGSRFSGAIKTIRELEPHATVLDGYSIARDRVPDSKDGVLKWLEKIGM